MGARGASKQLCSACLMVMTCFWRALLQAFECAVQSEIRALAVSKRMPRNTTDGAIFNVEGAGDASFFCLLRPVNGVQRAQEILEQLSGACSLAVNELRKYYTFS